MAPPCWIGIDPSYSAYAIVRLHADGSYNARKLDFSPEVTGQGSQRLDMIFRVLQEDFAVMRLAYNVRAVALEGYAMESKFGREMAGELGGLTKILAMRELRRNPLIVAPNALKKFVTGSGKSRKDAMKAGVLEKWGQDFKSHDLADAYGLAQIARASHLGTDVKYEQEVLDVVTGRNKKQDPNLSSKKGISKGEKNGREDR